MIDLTVDFQKWLDGLPLILSPGTCLHNPNEPVTIFKGKFLLEVGKRIVEIDGEIYFTWTPEFGIRFKGEAESLIFPEIINKIIIDGYNITHGHSFVTRVNENRVFGYINSPFVISYHEEKTDRVHFELPNFRNILGSQVNANGDMRRDRLTFENQDWSVIIDKVPDYERLKKELEEVGGYALLYTGELYHKKGKLNFDQLQKMVRPLGLFLSFLNGRRSYPCFLQGSGEKEAVWTDYSASYADRYKSVDSWLPQEDYSGISAIWDSYLKLATDSNNLECIDYILHWYIEANNNSGFSEGAIVLLQNAFELFFNWQMVEQRKLYTAKNARKINAADKIRILLEDASIPLELPARYKAIEKELHEQQIDFKDFPELFTLIRNAITHANLHKRLSLGKIPSLARHHVKYIGIRYLELLLLHLFNYQGKYANRNSENMFVGYNEELVPWAKI